jgi:signal transduction histidine kinase
MIRFWCSLCLSVLFLALPSPGNAQPSLYEHAETRKLVDLVKDASELVRTQGEAAFQEFSRPGSRWRQEETYIFVLDPQGNMLVHPDPNLQGKNQLDLKDINGKPIIRGLIDAATAVPAKPEGWYHYEWPVPGGLLPRWKSSYVRLVQGPDGKKVIVGSGMYNDRMERAFVVDTVKNAAGEIEAHGEKAFPLLHDPKGPFIFKDAYIFVIDMNGVELVNPAFPNLEGKNVSDVKDTQGKPFVAELLKLAKSGKPGWVNYMWPKPGENVSTQKSTYMMPAKLGNQTVVVACGTYLAEAPKAVVKTTTITAPKLMALVRDAANVFERQGEKAFPEFRKKGSKWFRDDTYFFVWTLDGKRFFHAANPASEGEDVSDLKDVMGRPIGKMFPAATSNPTGEGWVHYLWPLPGGIFPTWKSSFLKRVTFPSGKQYVIGCGIYNMEMDRAFIEDVVNRAAALVADRGPAAFDELRDKTGPYFFMDTYVFVDDTKGTELVNPGHPSLEGNNLADMKDLKGKFAVREYIDAAMKKGSAWVDYYWYPPGENKSAHKYAFVKKIQSGDKTYIVGSGYYPRAGK